jgi:hypothetical protein
MTATLGHGAEPLQSRRQQKYAALRGVLSRKRDGLSRLDAIELQL